MACESRRKCGFLKLLHGLDGYIDDLAPYQVDASKTIFCRLPVELRTEIYWYLLPAYIGSKQERLGRLSVDNNSTSNTFNIPIFLLNHSTRIDIALYFLSTHQLYLDSSTLRTITAFLETLPGEQGFRAVRWLTITDFSRSLRDPGADIESYISFIERCTGLRALSLGWNDLYLLAPSGGDTQSIQWEDWVTEDHSETLPFIEDVVRQHQLTKFLKLPVVDRIELSLNHCLLKSDEDLWPLLDKMGLMHEVSQWMERRFLEQGRVVYVACNWPNYI